MEIPEWNQEYRKERADCKMAIIEAVEGFDPAVKREALAAVLTDHVQDAARAEYEANFSEGE